MGIRIGNNNKIKKSNIVDNSYRQNGENKKTFFERHILIAGAIGSLMASAIGILITFFKNLF